MKKTVPLSEEEKRQISIYANEADLLWKRLKKRDGSLDKFIEWLEDNPDYQHGDKFGRTTIYEFVNNLNALRDGKPTAMNYELACKKTPVLITAATEYLNTPNRKILTGTKWFVYFVYSKKKQTPQIGRAILDYLDGNEAKLTNVPHITSKAYTGRYYNHERIIYFDLDNADRNKLHIKIECPEEANQEIALGAYCTYESNHIVTGTLIFQKIEDEVPEAGKATPELLSYNSKGDSRKIFEKIPACIKKYLCVKNLNYHSIPYEIYTLEELNKHIDNFNPFDEKRRANRFIESDKPTIFISVPSVSIKKNTSADAEFIESIIGQLREEFKEEATLVEKHSEWISPLNKVPGKSLKQLREVSIFILIISSVDVASFSLVQLGYAIAHCKRVLVFFKESAEKKTVSERMKSLGSVGVETIMYSDLNIEFSEKYTRLSDKIREYLRDIA